MYFPLSFVDVSASSTETKSVGANFGGNRKIFHNMRGDPRVTCHNTPRLFADADRAPQLPYELCRMPTAARPNSRHLRANTALLQKAQSACSDAVTSAGDLELCIDDVMVTGELGLASVW
jgi:hypothetical protein